MNAQTVLPCDLSELNYLVFPDNKLVVMPHAFWEEREYNEIMYFMYTHGMYVLPTTELIDWLRENITGIAIEIGAGNGAISRALGIPITDSCLQEDKAIMLMYKMMDQPPITYNEDVEKLNAEQAIEKYKPDTVIGAFITHKWHKGMKYGNPFGVQEEDILSRVKRYIHIGNMVTHAHKPILKRPHQQYYYDWLITRSAHNGANRIFVFDGL